MGSGAREYFPRTKPGPALGFFVVRAVPFLAATRGTRLLRCEARFRGTSHRCAVLRHRGTALGTAVPRKALCSLRLNGARNPPFYLASLLNFAS